MNWVQRLDRGSIAVGIFLFAYGATRLDEDLASALFFGGGGVLLVLKGLTRSESIVFSRAGALLLIVAGVGTAISAIRDNSWWQRALDTAIALGLLFLASRPHLWLGDAETEVPKREG